MQRYSGQLCLWPACAGLLMTVALLSLPRPAQGRDLKIGHGGEFATVQAALQSCQDGDRLLLAPGNYNGRLVVDRRISIVGQGLPLIQGDYVGSVVTIVADDVHIEGLRISGTGKDMMHSDAGVMVEADRVVVSGCVLSDNLFGIYLRQANKVLVEGNRITGRRELDMGSRGAGMHLYDSDRNMLRNNDVSYVRDGIYFDHADDNTVEGNTFSNLRYGVHYMYCDANRFYRNIFRDSMAGAAIMYSDNVEFSDNQILNNRLGYSAYGLLLQACRNCRAERNVIVNNSIGIFLEGAHNNLLANNLVAYNDLGVQLFASSSDNTFAENDFIQNIATLRTIGRAYAIWNPPGAGNYYSDYKGYDLDLDGKGDVSHQLQDSFEYLTGSRPLLRLFLSSAAADALRLAEDSFPVLPASDFEDTQPQIRPRSGVRISAEAGAGSMPQPAPLAAIVCAVATLVFGLLGWRLAR